MARVYADVNQTMPRSYWDYDSVNISTPTSPRAASHIRACPFLLTILVSRLGSPRELRGCTQDWYVVT